jgi:UDPglucose 6-dehydrogenase
MKIVVVGLGYVGLGLSVLLAKSNEVIGYDNDFVKLENLKNKISPIKDNKIQEQISSCNLDFNVNSSLEDSLKNVKFVFLCLPTSFKNGKLDTSILENVIRKILSYNKKIVIIIKSTIPIGFTDKVIKDNNYNNIIFSPEFSREGHSFDDNLIPSRIIVSYNEENLEFAKEVSKILSKDCINSPKILFMKNKEAESVKLLSNTYLAMRVAFFNEVDSLSNKLGMSTKDIIDGICLDNRIGDYYNNPSFGYGGYCLPKDTKEVIRTLKNLDFKNSLIGNIDLSNRKRIDYIVKEILSRNCKNIGIYRLIMKSGSDNFRDSAIFNIIKKLQKNDVKIIIYEPLLNNSKQFILNNDLKSFKENCDLIIANRYQIELDDVKDKVLTKDLFYRN